MSNSFVTIRPPVIAVKAAHLSSAILKACHLCLHAIFCDALFKVHHASAASHNYLASPSSIMTRELQLPLLLLLQKHHH